MIETINPKALAMKRTLVVCLVGGMLAASCAVVPPGHVPPATPAPAVPAQPAPSSPAVVELSGQARQALEQHRYDEAVQLLERAIDIEPRNGGLWHEMAQVRYAQGSYEQAIQLARRSNALPGTDPGLKAKNDELIKASRNALGN
ncbi:MAG: tetratricopeptide repeat protein [Arenicellales bacterium]|jgi:Tfp pilus assembly protein PilF